MLIVYPEYYRDFQCIANKCKHTCCKDWEIDIDKVSLERFKKEPFISNHIIEENGVQCFRLTADEKCPFLRSDGLCELIIRYGEDMLCDICTDHPRFRNYFSDRTEIGLGLSCEAAAELILNRTAPTRLLISSDAEPFQELTDDEQYILSYRDEMIRRLQDRSRSIADRFNALLKDSECELTLPNGEQLYKFLISLEFLDSNWHKLLEPLKAYKTLPFPNQSTESELLLEQLAVYFVYRHIAPAAEDDDLYGRICLCGFLWYLSCALIAVHGTDSAIEIYRMISSELEYSDENLQLIIDALT